MLKELNYWNLLITPSVRPDFLPIIEKCLKRQDFQDFEWIVVSPKEIDTVKPDILLKDPPKKEGDFWTLCKAWNLAFNHVKGELVVIIQDGIWFPPDLLSRFWSHYQVNPKGLVTAVGHQYDQLDQTGKPINEVWHDPRSGLDLGTFYEVLPPEMEMAVCSIPKQAILDCGGVDEEYDKCPAVGEKEMCFRLRALGYKFYIDQTIEYRAIHHPRLTEDWDKKYWEVSCPMFTNHMKQLGLGERLLKMPYIKE